MVIVMKQMLYRTAEERFCTRAKENVVVQTVHFSDGTREETCLHQHGCEQKKDCGYTKSIN